MSVPAPHVRQRRRARSQRLLMLGFESYPAYLASPHWRTLKARYRASDLPQDCMCGATEGLQFHHKTYERIGCERLEDLIPLCGSCHQMVHTLDCRGEMGISLADFADKRAERYAPDQAARTSAARSEYRDVHRKRHARNLGNRMKTAVMAGAFTSEELAEIDRLLSRVEARVLASWIADAHTQPDTERHPNLPRDQGRDRPLDGVRQVAGLEALSRRVGLPCSRMGDRT